MQELDIIQKIAIFALPLLFAITLHEVAHGWVASKFGDQTARLLGRLTLNPLKHIDPVGTIIVPLLLLVLTKGAFIFGWAKPVPVDARNLRNPRRDMAIVASAGPISNILMAMGWALISKGGFALDATHPWFGEPMILMGQAGMWINIILAALNIIPIPPLDGSKVLYSVLPPRAAWQLSRIEPYGFFILVALIATGMLTTILSPIANFLMKSIIIMFGLYQ